MTRTYSSPLRAEQAQAARRRILDAARAQFLDRGWTGTTVKVIADAVAPATVYAIFGTKRAVLSVLIDEALANALPDPNHPDAWPEIVRQLDQRERAPATGGPGAGGLSRVAPLERVVREGASADEEIAGLARDSSNGGGPPRRGWWTFSPARTASVSVSPGRKPPTSSSPWAAPKSTTFRGDPGLVTRTVRRPPRRPAGPADRFPGRNSS